MKVMTVRLDDEQGQRLSVMARAEGVTMSELVRAAVDDYIARRCSDEGFQKRLERSLEAERQAADSLVPRPR